MIAHGDQTMTFMLQLIVALFSANRCFRCTVGVLFDDSGTYQVVENHARTTSNIACYCNGSATGYFHSETNHETNFLCVGSLSFIRTVIIPVCDWIDTNSVTTMYVNGV